MEVRIFAILPIYLVTSDTPSWGHYACSKQRNLLFDRKMSISDRQIWDLVWPITIGLGEVLRD